MFFLLSCARAAVNFRKIVLVGKIFAVSQPEAALLLLITFGSALGSDGRNGDFVKTLGLFRFY